MITRSESLLRLPRLRLLLKASTDRGKERYRRAGITAASSVFSKALAVIISFASVPLTVHYLGTERYGVWLTISSLLTWMAVTDFGLAGNALVNVIADASGKDDRQTAREYAASAFWGLLAISGGIGLISLITFHFIPWRAVFRVSAGISTAELQQACAITLAIFVVSLPLAMLNSVYSAYQDGFVSNVWGIASNGVALISLIIATQFRGGLTVLVLALFGSRTAIVMASAFYAFYRRYPWLAPALSAVRWTRTKRLFSLGGKYMLTQLASLGIYQSQPIIITQLFGPAQVTIFVVAYKIIALPVDLSYMATVPFVSAFAEAKARTDWKWIKGAYRNSTLVSLVLGLPIVAILALAAKPLIRVWAGPAAVPSSVLVLSLSIYTLIAVALMPAGQLLSGLERVGRLAFFLSLCAMANIGFGILFARHWGLSGIAFAMAASKVVFYWPVAYEIYHLFNGPNALDSGNDNAAGAKARSEFARTEG